LIGEICDRRTRPFFFSHAAAPAKEVQKIKLEREGILATFPIMTHVGGRFSPLGAVRIGFSFLWDEVKTRPIQGS
jgi:glucose-6-phosphate isomerase